jgi:hypothetical protein
MPNNQKFKHAVLYVGNRMSGKISRVLLSDLADMGITGVDSFLARTTDAADALIVKLNDDPLYSRVDVIFLYCEDTGIKNRKHLVPKLALNGEKLISSLSNSKKFHIHHPYSLGELFGDKIKSNKMLTQLDILCPEIITNPEYDKPIFVNVPNGSRSPEAKVIPNGSFLNPKMYNTKLIDASYEYQGKTYYVNPRLYALGDQITHFMIKCAPAERSDRVVRVPGETTYAEAPGLQYDFFKTQIVPEYQILKDICAKLEKKFGFQAYCFDLLKDVKEKKWYVCEIMFKFDSGKSVRIAPYSFITYRQIAKEVYGKVYEEDARLEALEKIPDEFLNSDYLPKEIYRKKLESIHYWIRRFLAKHFREIYYQELKKTKN